MFYRPFLWCLRDENTHHRNSIKKKQQEIAYCASIGYYNIRIDTVPRGIPLKAATTAVAQS